MFQGFSVFQEGGGPKVFKSFEVCFLRREEGRKGGVWWDVFFWGREKVWGGDREREVLGGEREVWKEDEGVFWRRGGQVFLEERVVFWRRERRESRREVVRVWRRMGCFGRGEEGPVCLLGGRRGGSLGGGFLE